MQSLPSLDTIHYFITDKSERYPQSETMTMHNKGRQFERRLALYLTENIKFGIDKLEDYVYATQLVQSEAMAYAYRSWRREWKAQKYVGGALAWQMNDCWPGTSWALCDFFKRPKLAYYAVKRESASITLGISRYPKKTLEPDERVTIFAAANGPHVYDQPDYSIDVWACNTTMVMRHATLEMRYYDVESGALIRTTSQDATLTPNQSTDLLSQAHCPSNATILARMYDKRTGMLLARATDWPQPLKYLKFPNRTIQINIKDQVITLSTNAPIKGVWLTAGSDDVFFEDNGMDLYADDARHILCRGLTAKHVITVRAYDVPTSTSATR